MTKKKATKKAAKKVAKKAVKKAAKKVAKKAAKKVSKKAATRKPESKPTEGKRMPLSRFVCNLLLSKVPDEEIIEEMKKEYPDKDCSQKTVSWYRFAINKGRMEKLGFAAPEGGLTNPRREASAKKKAEKESKKADKAADSSKKAVKKVARRKTATRRK